MKRFIDLDANATTRVHPRVQAAMLRVLRTVWGNPSSSHRAGQRAKHEVEMAREAVANLLHVSPAEIVFTSGATEAITLAIRGVLQPDRDRRGHVITTAVEHKATFGALQFLERYPGWNITVLKPDAQGKVHAAEVKAALRENTRLVAVIHGNNEIGTMNPIAQIAAALEGHPARLFVDAAQTLGFVPSDLGSARIDLLAVSAHKMYGPKGVGALFVRRSVRVEPLFQGGGQEAGFRSGTENVPGIVGFGAACQLARQDGPARTARVVALRDTLWKRLREGVPDAFLNGHPADRLPNNLSVCFPNVDANMLLRRLPHLALSRGSACTSGTNEPSHVLQAIGLSKREELWTVRMGVTIFNTTDEITQAAADISRVVHRLRHV